MACNSMEMNRLEAEISGNRPNAVFTQAASLPFSLAKPFSERYPARDLDHRSKEFRPLSSKLYPLFLNLKHKPVMVVGAGRVAVRKIRALLDCGASVTVVAPEADPRLLEMADRGQVVYLKKAFEDGDMDGARLAVAATPDRGVNEAAHRAAARLGVFINVVDVPDLCDFHVPSVVDRAPLRVAISTEGNAPALARNLRKELESIVPEALGGYVAHIGALRERVKTERPEFVSRAAEMLAESEAKSLWLAGKTEEAKNRLEAELDDLMKKTSDNEEVRA